MSEQQGQTDTVLKIKLTSQLLAARWLDAEISPTGRAGLEVLTQWVGEGAPIKITYKDLEGKTLGTAEGKVMANHFRTFYKPSGANATGGVTFEAELPKHSLKKTSGRLSVGKPVEFSALRFTDPDGNKELTEIAESVPAACEAKVKGLEEGALVAMTVSLRTGLIGDGMLVVESEVPVKDGKVRLLFVPKVKARLDKIRIQLDLDKEGGTYFQPEYVFTCRARGVKTTSDAAKAVQSLTLHFWEFPGSAGALEGKTVTITGPDGKKDQQKIPKDGTIDLKKTKPGKHKVESDSLKDMKAKPDATGGPADQGLDEITLKDAQGISLDVTSVFEGKGYAEVTTNFDGMGISFGALQWNFGSGGLAPVLKKFKAKDEAALKACFNGNDNDYKNFLAILDKPQAQQLSWSIGIQSRHKVKRKSGKEVEVWKLDAPWDTYWNNIGEEKKFHEVQKEIGIPQYHKRLNMAMAWLRTLYPKAFGKITLRGYAALFDMCVNQGSLTPKHKPPVKEALDKLNSSDSIEMLKALTDVVGSMAAGKGGTFRANCVSRRWGILAGQAVYVERPDKAGNMLKSKRDNKNFSLLNPDKVLKDY